MRKKGTFKYIDKDKILPYLDMNIEDINQKISGNDPYYDGWNKGAIQALKHLRGKIKDGFFDFQQGSE